MAFKTYLTFSAMISPRPGVSGGPTGTVKGADGPNPNMSGDPWGPVMVFSLFNFTPLFDKIYTVKFAETLSSYKL